MNLAESWTLAAGIRTGHAWLEGQSGVALFISSDDAPIGIGFVDITHDTLDDYALPRRGHRLEASFLAPSQALGSEADNTRFEWTGDQAISFGRRRFLLGLAGANVTHETLGYGESSLLGGLFRLSGYHIDELIGEDYMLARLIYFDTRGGGARSAFAGIDTALGSLYLAYGHAEAGRQAVYFIFGTLFDIGRSATFGSF